MSLEQTRGRDHDPCDEGGEERELQQQLMQDESHRKSPLRSGRAIAQSSLVAKATRQENSSKSFRVLMDIGAPPYAASPTRASEDVGQKVMEGWPN
jgi:hypothetical protein